MPERPEILLVEDEEPLRELMKVALGSDYHYLEAEDLPRGFELLRAHAPSVVLLDIMLPGGSGLDLLRAARGDPALDGVRIVVVSAWQTPEDRRAALELGADGFLSKPFDLDTLETMLDIVL